MFSRAILFVLSVLFVFPAYASSGTDKIVVYSARKEHLIKPLFDLYTANTGVKIEYITGKEGVLLERLKAEGKNTPADMLITVDAGNLWHAAQEGVLQPTKSEVLDAAVPANLRDPAGNWFGLSVRARTIVYNTEKVQPSQLSGYEALAGEEWKKKLVLRTSKKVYNQSLVASLLAEHGEEQTSKIVQGWVSNLAAAPFSNDTKALEAVAAGIGHVTIVNTYYFGRLLKKKPEIPLAIFWPTQESGGVHMNVSGAGITKHADNRDGAVKLLEWLAGEEAQAQFAALNMEFPVNSAVKPDPVVASWGTFHGSPLNVSVYGTFQTDAIKLMDKAGYK
ncbi:extracellular solute-binding protein [Desulfopila sp. IMCC35008]|uniref:extracellular solute-binding protein n=1 Tax=Desulfopila sp. IMCC35008 TaxID=2653858 RepID=UPI0013D6EBA7|nr:extracellular solute-binding protein [Desulfopila sp. IMCC35008]